MDPFAWYPITVYLVLVYMVGGAVTLLLAEHVHPIPKGEWLTTLFVWMLWPPTLVLLVLVWISDLSKPSTR